MAEVASLPGCRENSLNAKVAKGAKVLVNGTIISREYTDRQGQQRTSLDVNAQSVDLLVPPKNAQPADDTFQNSPF